MYYVTGRCAMPERTITCALWATPLAPRRKRLNGQITELNHGITDVQIGGPQIEGPPPSRSRPVDAHLESNGRVVGVSWTCRGHVVGVSWACRGRVVGVSWRRRGRVVGASWAVSWAVSWRRRGGVVGVSWAVSWACRRRCRGRVVDMSWARRGITGSAVVEDRHVRPPPSSWKMEPGSTPASR